MINVKKDFQDLQFQRDFIKKETGAFHIIDYIHRYDRQKLKSLLNEQLEKEKKDYCIMKE